MSLNFDAMSSRVQRNKCAVRGQGAPQLLDRFYNHAVDVQADRKIPTYIGRGSGRDVRSGNKILAGLDLTVHDLVYEPNFAATSTVVPAGGRVVRLDKSGKKIEPKPERAMRRCGTWAGGSRKGERFNDPAQRHVPTTAFARQISRDQRARSASGKRDKEKVLSQMQNSLNPLYVNHRLVDATVPSVDFGRGEARSTLPHHNVVPSCGLAAKDMAPPPRPHTTEPSLNPTANSTSHIQHLSSIGAADLSFFTTEATSDISKAFTLTRRPLSRAVAFGPGYRPPPPSPPVKKSKKPMPFSFGGRSPTRRKSYRHPALAAESASYHAVDHEAAAAAAEMRRGLALMSTVMKQTSCLSRVFSSGSPAASPSATAAADPV